METLIRALEDSGCLVGNLATEGLFCAKELARALKSKGFSCQYLPLKSIDKKLDKEFDIIIMTDGNFIPIENYGSAIGHIEPLLTNVGSTVVLVFKKEAPPLLVNGNIVPWHFSAEKILMPKIHEDHNLIIYRDKLFPDEFKCLQCGGCCTNIYGGYQFSPTPRDIFRWKNRPDILHYVEHFRDMYDAWIDPKIGDDMDYCPWKRKVRGQNRYICRINDVKPDHCRVWFPKNEKSALKVKCAAWLSKPWPEHRVTEECD